MNVGCSCAGEVGCGGTCAFAVDRVELLRRAREVYGAHDEAPRARDRSDRKALLYRARQRLSEIQSSPLNSVQVPRNDVGAADEPRKVAAETLRYTLDEDIAHVQKQIESILACSAPTRSHADEEGANSQRAMSAPGSSMLAALEKEVAAAEATQMSGGTG